MTFVADFAQLPHTQHLRDCQGQQLHVSGTKDAELIVNGLDVTQAILKQQFIVGDVTNCLPSPGQLMRGGWTISKTTSCQSGMA